MSGFFQTKHGVYRSNEPMTCIMSCNRLYSKFYFVDTGFIETATRYRYLMGSKTTYIDASSKKFAILKVDRIKTYKVVAISGFLL